MFIASWVNPILYFKSFHFLIAASSCLCRKVNYETYGPLKEAIESYLMSSVKDIARIVTKSKSRDDDQKKKHNEMIQTLIDEYGYNKDSAEEILTYAANNLWRDA